ncbi:type VI secretion system tube protein TssD [Hymenobacter volaticus]|uniref:NAD(+)--protein-arginine ADP-ribosyltransferase n=1 Tax=Hymenobacter volaticus TaxID=2932254 RepID=A0ABY4G4W6_9BACT|nr:type VI secretion system tube protein TssD [Hymenobacter volaticus]UOQ65806.1 ADP-ribosyltransferase domain-containing protein [Hymenobacter volaticus]
MNRASFDGTLHLPALGLQLSIQQSHYRWVQHQDHRGRPCSKVRFGSLLIEVLANQEQLAELTQLAANPFTIVDGHAAYTQADGQGTFVTVWFQQASLHHFTEYFDATGTRGTEASWVVQFALAPQQMGRDSGTSGSFVAPAPGTHGESPSSLPTPAVAAPAPLSDIEILFSNGSLVEIRNNILSGLYSREHSNLISVEEQAVVAYYTTGEGYRNFNQALRGEMPMTDFFRAQERVLNGALEKLPKYQSWVVRGTGESETKRFAAAAVGDVIEYDNFVSSSLEEFIADDFMYRKNGEYVLRIKSKNGVRITEMSMAKSEDEVLFLSKRKFKVTSKSYRPRFTEDDPLIKEINLEEL